LIQGGDLRQPSAPASASPTVVLSLPADGDLNSRIEQIRNRGATADHVFCVGTFIFDGSATTSEVSSNTCHASAQGELALSNQAVAKWGK
jgi:hypothetical protein